MHGKLQELNQNSRAVNPLLKYCKLILTTLFGRKAYNRRFAQKR